jgi:probable HAF family extracellular repeat protein
MRTGFTLVCVAFASSTAASGQSIVTLERPRSGGVPFVCALSDTGGVAVGGAPAAVNGYRGAMWDRRGLLHQVGDGAGDRSIAMGVSADGAVIVGNTPVFGGGDRVFRFDGVGGLRDLGTLGGGFSRANAASTDARFVVGESDRAGPPGPNVFVWSEETGMVDLGIDGSGHAVSDDGRVVAGTTFDASGVARAFRWEPVSGLEDLGTLGGNRAEALGVSGDGSVIVGYSSIAGQAVERAFRWTRETGMIDLGPTDVNGVDRWICVRGDGRAVVWTARGAAGFTPMIRVEGEGGGAVTLPLADYLASAGVDMGGWNLKSVSAMSRDGRSFAGWGTLGRSGNTSVWVARLAPEPCAADVNWDGAVDFFDVTAFEDAFARGLSQADVDGDGTVDFFDFEAFADVFERGC